MAALKQRVIDGPDPERDGVVRGCCVDLRAEIAQRFAVTVHERTVGKLLRRLGLTRLQPRPFHLKRDPAARWAGLPTPNSEEAPKKGPGFRRRTGI